MIPSARLFEKVYLMKSEKIRLLTNGKETDHWTLTKDDPRLLVYVEHSAVTKQLRKGKPKKKAKADYLARVARELLAGALSVIEDLSTLDKIAADTILREYFFKWPLDPVTYEDGEPVNLEDFEEN